MSIELSYIRDITKEEHREFMEFLRMKTRILFNHEVAVALDQGKIPKNSYQGIFHQSQCCIAEPNGNVKIFFAYTREFITFARQIFAKVTRMDPKIFHKDAYDIMKSFYEVSNYALMNKTEEDYIRYISSDTCVYIAFKENGEFKDRIFRLDLFRKIEYDAKSKMNEFTGGLFHVLSHFRMDDSTHSDNILDLWHLVRVCATAFVNRITPVDDSTLELYLYWNNKYDLHFIYYREEESNVYYIKTFYVRERKEWTIEENKKCLIDDKGEIIVPFKYDEVHFDHKSHMNTHQLIVNKTGIKSFDAFNNEGYSSQVISLCYLLEKFHIYLVNSNETLYAKEAQLNENDAFAYYLNKEGYDASSTYAEIIVNTDVCHKLGLTEQELLAAVAHEVGHIILYFSDNKEILTDFDEEILSDKVACKIGLSKPLHSLLHKLLNSHLCSKDQETLFKMRLIFVESENQID